MTQTIYTKFTDEKSGRVREVTLQKIPTTAAKELLQLMVLMGLVQHANNPKFKVREGKKNAK